MEKWSNWSGRHESRLQALRFVRSEDEAVAVVKQAAADGQKIRVAGSGHSHSPLVSNDDVILDTTGLAGVIDVDRARHSANIWAGSKIYSLGRPLHDAGLALKNQGDIDRQAIAGACATGTHGTGKDLQNLSASVLGFDLVTAAGEVVRCNAGENESLWQAGRLSLGAFGFITRLELQLRESYVLKESGYQAQLDELWPDIPELIETNERFEFFWYPQSGDATVKIINQTDEPPHYPLAPEGQRCAWNYEVLPNHRPHPHTEMEYSVPLENGLDCLSEIRDLLKNEFPEVAWPVEYRTVAADDLWLSMAYGRPTVTISVHQDVRVDETAYYQACEAIFLRYGGRPHWGKVNYLDANQMAEAHPAWEDWWEVRNNIDPDQVFLNEYLCSLAPR